MSVFDHPDFDDHQHVAFYEDKDSGLRAIIAVHNTHLGAGLGGCRMYPYANSDEALTDVLRLSKGMTYKAALANLPYGGGKSVIIGNPKLDKSADMMKAMGTFVNNFNGTYLIAEDSGMSVSDIHTMEQVTQFTGGTQAHFNYLGGESDGNPAPATAYGVFCSIKKAVEHQFSSDLQGKRIAIKGLGQVGLRLAEHLHKAGAQLFVADVYPEGPAYAAQHYNASVVDTNDIDTLDVDVFAPCALGKAIHADNIHLIKAKVVAGAANNQLASPELGDLLMQRGILYAPDYVANAGGIIDIYHQKINSSAAQLKTHLESIADTLQEIFDIAAASQRSTALVADELAEQKFKS